MIENISEKIEHSKAPSNTTNRSRSFSASDRHSMVDLKKSVMAMRTSNSKAHRI